MIKKEAPSDDIAQIHKKIDFIESEPFEKGFADYFNREIKPDLIEIEKDRLNRLAEASRRRKVFWLIIIGIVAADSAILAAIVTWLPQSNLALFFYASTALGVTSYFWHRSPIARYMSRTRRILVPKVVRFFGDSFDFEFDTQCDTSAIEKSRILPVTPHNLAGSRLTGVYKGIDIDMCRLEIGSDKNELITLFSGLFVVLEVHKRFQGTTIITYDQSGVFDYSTASIQGLEHAQLESSGFEKRFDVFTSDQIEARYLLTPDIMENFVELSNENNIAIKACFTGQRLYISIPHSEMIFTSSQIDKTALDTVDVHKFLHQMNAIFRIIDLLKLDHAIEINTERSAA